MIAGHLLGPCIRTLPAASGRPLYLTFDDGPHPGCTADVLRVLEKAGARATFFVVADRVARYPELLSAIRDGGHAVGNHSLDHRYGAFFRSREHLRDWIARAEAELTERLSRPTVGFRSPAGVRTPPLAWALRRLGLPHISWSVRYFDTVRGWPRERALSSLARTLPGSIVLLHDTHEGLRKHEFLQSLEAYLEKASALGFRLLPLPDDLRSAS